MRCRFTSFSHYASRELVHEFRHRTLVLVKALILQKKVSKLVTHSQRLYRTHSFSRYYFMDTL
jgi:Transport protein Avl9